MEIIVGEAGDKQKWLLHGTWDTTDDLLSMCEAGEKIGMEGMLLGHPNSYYYTEEEQVYNYIKEVADGTNLAICTFAAPQWDFTRFDPRGYPMDALIKAGEIDNIVACKFEVGGIASGLEFHRRNNGNVLYSEPRTQFFPIAIEMFDIQWVGTSCFELYGDNLVKMFNLFREGKFEEGTELYWKMAPVRAMKETLSSHLKGSNFLHRYTWKFWGWLNGYNGGPLRQPTNRIVDSQMNASRAALIKAGFDINENESNADFFKGRNPA
jgi:4-hydroxy-tetrahydrodipicolinate synthase